MGEKRKGVENYINSLIEKGFKKITNDYICDGKIILNRGDKKKSNFFIFIDPKREVIFFSNPTGKEGITYRKFSEVNDGFFQRTMEISSQKRENERYAFLHSHLGYVWNGKKYESLWGDGISKDKEWIIHTILAHGDVKALTEHNWTQNEYRLGLLDERLESFNITFIPGWENTTVINKDKSIDLIQSPHILCYCKNIEIAMKIKEVFLRKKLRKDVEITPIYSGVPMNFFDQIKILDEFRKNKEIFYIVAHPFSTLPGIDIFDPKCLDLGIDTILKVVEKADGVEMYNSLERHGNIKSDLLENKKYGKLFVDWLKIELALKNLNESFTPSMLNYLIGLIMKEKGKNTIYGQDDHYLVEDVNEKIRSPYLRGHTKFFFERKLNSDEFVEYVIDGKIKLSAYAYCEITNDGPKVFDEREEDFKTKLLNLFKKVEYFLNLGVQTINFYIAKYLSKKGIEEISEIKKEMEKSANFQ